MTNCRYLDGINCLHTNSGVDLCVLLKPNTRPKVYITCKLERGIPKPLYSYTDGIHPRTASEK